VSFDVPLAFLIHTFSSRVLACLDTKVEPYAFCVTDRINNNLSHLVRYHNTQITSHHSAATTARFRNSDPRQKATSNKMVSPIINFALRGAQALFAVVVLGLSVTLIRGHQWGSLPASLGFAAFVGGVSFLGAMVGLAASFFDFLGGMVGLVVDGIVALLNVACGVVRTFQPSSQARCL
jgi:hypothetical protein